MPALRIHSKDEETGCAVDQTACVIVPLAEARMADSKQLAQHVPVTNVVIMGIKSTCHSSRQSHEGPMPQGSRLGPQQNAGGHTGQDAPQYRSPNLPPVAKISTCVSSIGIKRVYILVKMSCVHPPDGHNPSSLAHTTRIVQHKRR